MANVPALILDMDGVIIDSNPWHRIAWEEYNRSLGVETTEDMQRRMYGKRNEELIREFFGKGLTDAEVSAHGRAKELLYRRMMKPHLNEALVPGIREFLIRHHEFNLAVATNAEAANVDFVLGETGLKAFFRIIIGGHQVINPKPHPEIYLRVAAALGISPGECIVFEDSHTGIESARAAGMRVVGVSTTHQDLDGVCLQIRDFNDPALEDYLARAAQQHGGKSRNRAQS